ncbi:hypothetical protein PVK06_021413 [Gossypium arboreum]|uniref:Uncharacterized protein n=1 Tax=Gossypium arboreum TaxID=29729 RepID=A0ABR0PQH3_GOSAR|nr:hypothetical protein PVK06_021413 [Gossypium arboreum]
MDLPKLTSHEVRVRGRKQEKMAPRKRVSRYLHFGIVIPLTVWKIENTLQWYHDIYASKNTPRFDTIRDVAISSSGYQNTVFVKGTNLDKKNSLCPPSPPITQYLCRGIFGNKKPSGDNLKQLKLDEEERHTLS